MTTDTMTTDPGTQQWLLLTSADRKELIDTVTTALDFVGNDAETSERLNRLLSRLGGLEIPMVVERRAHELTPIEVLNLYKEVTGRVVCMYCGGEIPPSGSDHWKTCPKHPAGEEVLRLQAALDAVLAGTETDEPTRLRCGQRLFNELTNLFPSFAEKIRGTVLDPFYDDQKVGDCLRALVSHNAPNPVPMLLHCPECSTRHVDKGEFATKPHHTHSCQKCGMTWRPAIIPTVGVQHLPGFKDDPETPLCPGPNCMMCSGEACNKCGAGCWSNVNNCEHDGMDRHAAPEGAPPSEAETQQRALLMKLRAYFGAIWKAVPHYPSSSMGGGSAMEAMWQDDWEKKHGSHREVLLACHEQADLGLWSVDQAVRELDDARKRVRT